ncbi:hypothetical protein AB0B45_09165 [Nonomuraea sp. NPDC049152]|uniref:hypothetical protein n=1 Tax=Nonomuraea sp. NPDC049152 TaxID=3154350 RepID=UPI0033ECA8B5
MVFNIGSQQGNINNVAGDQTIYGGQQAFVAGRPTDWAARLAEALRGEGLRQEAAQAEAVQAELARPEPDRQAIAGRLTTIAQAVGAVAGAGTALREPLAALANWLGTMGAPILRLIGL